MADRSPIPYARQSIDAADIAAVVEIMQSDFLTHGPAVERFERAVADYAGVQHAIAASSGTAALHVGLAALGVDEDSLVWTSPNSFVASANAARYLGADVDFVDIDPRTYNMSADELERKLVQAERAGRLPDVVVPVDFAGAPCDYGALLDLRGRYGFRILEDASHAIGATWEQRRLGTWADATVFSFHPVKIVTSAEGGMLVTDDPQVAAHASRFRIHGITRDPQLMEYGPQGGWYYEQLELGYNYRLTELQAALGASQLQRIETFIARRSEIAARYDRELRDLALGLPYRDPRARSALHLYVVAARDARERLRLYEALHRQNVRVNVHYIPIHLQPYYRRRGFNAGDFPASERYYERALSLPMYAGLSDDDQSRVIAELRALAPL